MRWRFFLLLLKVLVSADDCIVDVCSGEHFDDSPDDMTCTEVLHEEGKLAAEVSDEPIEDQLQDLLLKLSQLLLLKFFAVFLEGQCIYNN